MPQSVTDPAESAVAAARHGHWVTDRRDLWTVVFGVVAGVGFSLPSLMSPGWLLVLDWTTGPHPRLASAYSGFGTPGGSLGLLRVVLAHALGGAPSAWFFPALCFPLSSFAIGRLVRGGLSRRIPAAAVYALNPFVFERLAAGQVGVLLGYALLPLAAASVTRLPTGAPLQVARAALWIALIASLSYHFVYIIGLAILAVLVWEHRWIVAGRAVGCLVLVAILSAYVIIPSLGPHSTGVAVGSQDLASYRTASDPTWGLYVNVLGLYGFWRSGPVLPKNLLLGWPLILLAILVVVVVGAWSAWRKGRHLLVGSLGMAGLMAYFLALGSQGPTGAIFKWLYFHFPPFDIMREPEKFSALIALAYAVGFGFGAEELVRRIRRRNRRAWSIGLLSAVPLLYCPNIVYGLGGQLTSVQYPASWEKADQVMGDGAGKILFLPWHLYMAFPFTHGVIGNPAPDAFRRPVISGDNVEVGTLESDSTSARSAYLQSLFAMGPQLHEFGHLVAQLGVRYVVVASTVDYRSYGWLAHQSDLVKVFTSPQIVVYRNTAALPQGARVTRSLTVPTLADYVQLAQEDDLRGTAVFLDRGDTGAGPPGAPPDPVTDVRRLSSVSYSVAAGPPGWVVLPEDYSSAWKLGGRGARETVDGGVAVASPSGAGTAVYTTWYWVRAGDIISVAAVVLLGSALVAASVVSRRRKGSAGAASQEDGLES